MTRTLTGRHVLLIAVSAFAIIIAANMAMLFAATGTFPGLVVSNAYVASQKWNGRTERQKALGWTADVTYEDEKVTVRLTDPTGALIKDADLEVGIGRPTTDMEDRRLTLAHDGERYRGAVRLAPGRWMIEVRTRSGPDFHQQVELLAPGEQ